MTSLQRLASVIPASCRRLAFQVKPASQTGENWLELTYEGAVICRARIKAEETMITIRFLTVHEAHVGRGVGRLVVQALQRCSGRLEAEGVRFAARPFWRHVGFKESENGKDYVWTELTQG